MKLIDILNKLLYISKNSKISMPFICGGVARDKAIQKIHNTNNISKNFVDLDITTGDHTIHNLAKEFYISLSKDYKIKTKQSEDGHISVYIGKLKVDFSSNFVVPNIDHILLSKNIKNPNELQKEMFSRDFTCNSLLLDFDLQTIKDPTNMGLADIKNKLLRTCLDPNITFTSNPNRIIRAIYLAVKLDFELEKSMQDFIISNKDLIKKSPDNYLIKNIEKSFSINKQKTIELIDKLGLRDYLPFIDTLTKKSQLFTNYDYVENPTGPGSGLYTNLDKYKSVSEFRKKRRNKRKKLIEKLKKMKFK